LHAHNKILHTNNNNTSTSTTTKMFSFKVTVLSALVCLVNSQGDQYDPIYLGKFEKPIHSVDGDIFVLDEKTIYIQDFAHDGQAPDVFFWADGEIVPYITRSDLTPKTKLERFLPREDVVLTLPDNMSVFNTKRLSVWCRAFGISFGKINLSDKISNAV
jgi:hypothetical protein